MRAISTTLPGVLILEPKVFEDERGYLFEAYSQDAYREIGISCEFVQNNHSFSHQGVLRGLHYQIGAGQAKLIEVIRGMIIDVAVDICPDSPQFGRWVSVLLSSGNRNQFFIPAGFAHGFCTIEESEVRYMLSNPYDPEKERGIAWDDPDLAIDWPYRYPLLSLRDRNLPLLHQLNLDQLPRSIREENTSPWIKSSAGQS